MQWMMVRKVRTLPDGSVTLPLTLSPGIAGGQGLAARGLDAMLRGWWAIVRWFVV